MTQEAFVLLLRMVVSLAIVLALAFLLIRFVLPKMTGLAGNRGEEIEIVGVRFVDRQNKVVLLRAEGRRYLVAFSQHGVAVLDARAESSPAGRGGDSEGEAS